MSSATCEGPNAGNYVCLPAIPPKHLLERKKLADAQSKIAVLEATIKSLG